MTSLSNQQKLFCQKYVELGMNGTQAYLEVYKSVKKEATARTNASRLLTNANIIDYIAELQSELKDEAIMTAKERMKWLTEVIHDKQKEGVKVKTVDKDFVIGEGTADLNTKMRAIDILNKMDGQYTTKLEGNLGITKLEDVL